MIKKGGHNARLRYWINIGSVAEKFAAKTNDVAAISAYIITIIEISCGLPVGKVHHQHAITLTRLIELGMQILAISVAHIAGALRRRHAAVLARNQIACFRHYVTEHPTRIGGGAGAGVMLLSWRETR